MRNNVSLLVLALIGFLSFCADVVNAASCAAVFKSFERSSSNDAFKFIDYAQLESMSASDLGTRREHFATLLAEKQQLLPAQQAKWQESIKLIRDFIAQPHKDKTPQQFAKEQRAYEETIGSRHLESVLQQAEEDIQLIKHHIETLGRIIERRSAGEKSPFVSRLPIEARLAIGGKDREQVAEEISAAIRKSGIDPGKIVLRYFTSAREDVVRIFGIDKSGSTSNYEPSDVWDLQQILQQRGLKQDDGFYALPFDFMMRPHHLFLMIDDFIAGNSSLAIFDRSKVEDPNLDYVIFKEPKNKRDALLGVITAKP